MSDDTAIGKSPLFAPFMSSVSDVYQEICGKGGDPAESFDRFVNSLSSGSQSALQGFAAIIHSGGKTSLPTEYARFLGGGRNCPEGSDGQRTWHSRSKALLFDPAKLAGSDDDFAESYIAGIRSINDGSALAEAWEKYVAALMTSVQSVLPAVEELAAMHGRGQFVDSHELVEALSPLLVTFSASAAFVRDSKDPLWKSWEFRFIQTQSAKLSNFMGGVSPYLEMLDAGIGVGIEKVLKSVSSNLKTIFEPFDHIHYSYVVERSVHEHVAVEATERTLRVFPADPVALRLAIDDIVYTAGKTGGARIRVEWDEKRRAMRFVDMSGETSSLQPFAEGARKGRRALFGLGATHGSVLVPEVAVDKKSGRVLFIEISVPALGTLLPGATDGEKAPLEATKKPFDDTVDATRIKDARGALESAIKDDPEMKAAWEGMDEERKMRVVADLVVYAEALGRKDMKKLGPRIIRSALGIAPQLFSKPNALK